MFHRVGAETVKLRCPYVIIILEHGNARSHCVAGRRSLQLTDADIGVTISFKYSVNTEHYTASVIVQQAMCEL